MKISLLLLVVVLLLFDCYGETLFYVNPARVIDVVTSDWTDDGNPDRAVLVESETESDSVDLFVSLNIDPSLPSKKQETVVARNIAWRGALWGTIPELRLSPGIGSLQVISQNDAIGRNRWRTTLTIARRSGTLVVAGFTYMSRDTLNLTSLTECDVNLLTGRGVLDKRSFTTKATARPLVQWKAKDKVADCFPRR
eukprot:gb/GEZN01019260.1/.p1 GENE.gb/GEZN01019260.1/~~gb/GEZN01019260.1/.p1  ORF type:complete len:196 (+),score=22.40 gb/GEZN01019260.1/:67-654(+)